MYFDCLLTKRSPAEGLNPLCKFLPFILVDADLASGTSASGRMQILTGVPGPEPYQDLW